VPAGLEELAGLGGEGQGDGGQRPEVRARAGHFAVGFTPYEYNLKKKKNVENFENMSTL
jgi:hypothetical protein